MALPFDLRDLVSSGSKLQKDRARPVRLAVVIETDAADALIGALREQLRPQTVGGSLQVMVAGEMGAEPVAVGTDAVIAVAGSGGSVLRSALVAPRNARTPIVVVSLGDESVRTALADGLPQAMADLIVSDDVHLVIDRLGTWLVDEVASKRLALAHNFPFMRRAVAEEAVRATAWQNGLVGAVAVFPGADMPIMTANQAKMLLQIAAAFGERLGPDRVKELAAIVGGAFVFRSVARQALGFIPVLGWVLKGGIGYGGTIAMGMAAIAYFEQGADLTEVARRLKATAGDAAARLPRLRSHGAELHPATVSGQLTLPETTSESKAATGTASE